MRETPDECPHTGYVVRDAVYCADCGEMLSRNGEKGADIVNGSQCNVCGKPAVIHDLEYDEYYCQEHGEEYEVSTGPHEAVLQEAKYVTKSGRVLTEADIEALAQEAEEGYDVERFIQRYRETGGGDEMVVLGLDEAMLDYELRQPLKPWTITLEITVSAHGMKHAESLGTEVLDHALAGLDGAAGAVMRVEPNE